MMYTTSLAASTRAAGGACSRLRLALVRESASAYQTSTYQTWVDTALNPLRAAIPAVLELDVGEPDEPHLRDTLGQLQRSINQLSGLRSRIAGELEQRAIRAAGPGRRQQGLREARARTRDDTRRSPTQVKQDGETGRRLTGSPAAQDALAAGRLPSDHARVLAQTLHELGETHPQRGQVHDRLVAAAVREDHKTFARTCRQVLAETDPTAAQKKLDRDHTRRLRVCETDDGMTALHGQGTGWGAEIVHTALHAFARPQPQETRAPEQRTWDALVATCAAALDAGAGAKNRAVRPHVLITVKQPGPNSEPSVVEAAWTGPLPWTEVRLHLADVGVSGVLLDANDAPIAVSEMVRTVPAGLWKALQVRDRTCIAEGCDVPAGWCQVMHLDVPYRLGGKLSIDNAAAGCSLHHRMLDRKGWQITWFGQRPVLHHPDRRPRPPQDPTARPNPGDTSRPPPNDTSPPSHGATSRPPPNDGASRKPPNNVSPPRHVAPRLQPDNESPPRQSAASRKPPNDASPPSHGVRSRPPPNDATRARQGAESQPSHGAASQASHVKSSAQSPKLPID